MRRYLPNILLYGFLVSVALVTLLLVLVLGNLWTIVTSEVFPIWLKLIQSVIAAVIIITFLQTLLQKSEIEKNLVFESLPEQMAFRLWLHNNSGFITASIPTALILIIASCFLAEGPTRLVFFFIGVISLILFINNLAWGIWSYLAFRKIKKEHNIRQAPSW